MKSERNIVLVGGSGYIGIPIAHKLLSEGHKVTILDNLTYSQEYFVRSLLLNENFQFYNYDYVKNNDLKFLKSQATDYVILAGLVGDPITKKYPNYSFEVNGDNLRNFLLEVSNAEPEKVIFTSTCSNYGLIPEDSLADEGFELKPLSLYAAEKVSTEEYIISNKDNFSFQSIILRFATAFGCAPRMRFDLTLNEFTRDIYLKKHLEIFDADTWRPYCHVQDFANLILKVIESKNHFRGEVFNSGGDINNATKRQIIEIISNYLDVSNCSFVEGGKDRRNYKVSFEKVKREFNFEPSWTLDKGIKELILNLSQGLYSDIDIKNIYGNYEIEGKN